jgi:phosphoglycolate phosphatase
MQPARVSPFLVVFDLDGTLVDSKRDLASATNDLVRELGGAPLTEDAVGNMVGEGASVLVARALRASGLAEDAPGALARFLELYDARLLDTTRPYPGMLDTLDALADRASLAVLTNKPARATMRLLEALELQRFFPAVIGGDSPFGRKPDPAGLAELVSRAGATPAATLMVGDSPIDLETARRAGTRVCLARYGFGFRVPHDLGASEHVIDRPTELTGVFDALFDRAPRPR